MGFMDFLNLIDILVFIMLIINSVFSWKTYIISKSPQIIYLFIGFVLMACLQIGFISINYITPIEELSMVNKTIGEISVALRVLPVGFIMFGLIGIYRTVYKYIIELKAK